MPLRQSGTTFARSHNPARRRILQRSRHVIEELAVRDARVGVGSAVLQRGAVDAQQFARGGFGIPEEAVGFIFGEGLSGHSVLDAIPLLGVKYEGRVLMYKKSPHKGWL